MEFVYKEDWTNHFPYKGINMALINQRYCSPVDSFTIKHIVEERDVEVLVCVVADTPLELAHVLKGDDVA